MQNSRDPRNKFIESYMARRTLHNLERSILDHFGQRLVNVTIEIDTNSYFIYRTHIKITCKG